MLYGQNMSNLTKTYGQILSLAGFFSKASHAAASLLSNHDLVAIASLSRRLILYRKIFRMKASICGISLFLLWKPLTTHMSCNSAAVYPIRWKWLKTVDRKFKCFSTQLEPPDVHTRRIYARYVADHQLHLITIRSITFQSVHRRKFRL